MVDTERNVQEIFSAYLEKNGQRKTPERFAILAEIYATDDHFDMESLLVKMNTGKYRVSRATLYNTMNLLMDCDLVVKHQFGKNIALYERSHNYSQHDHLICMDCGKVFEFCDPRIQQIQNSTEKALNFTIEHHSLNFHGNCSVLKQNGSCPNRKL